jgi:hypothetical protein
MGTITFQGEKPYDLTTQQLPTTTAKGGIVMVTLPVFVADVPRQTVDIRVELQLEHAKQLWAQLDPAIRLVEAHFRAQR